ncbi:hypothetical protein B0H14DRAFT_3142378 [Mycena olivaceomarginata]|nr:hypothetical protein B0H14DRAFT_3142378 [Mycena olivaceomarginata]
MAPGDRAKADQIAFHIYTKLFHVLYAARASDQGQGTGKTDKWFNLETPFAPPAATPTLELDAFRALCTSPPSPSSSSAHRASMVVEVLLAVPPPGGGTALVHTSSGTRIEPEPRCVLLEEWVLAVNLHLCYLCFFYINHCHLGIGLDIHVGVGVDVEFVRYESGSTAEDGVLLPTIHKNAIPLFRALYALLRILPAWHVVRKLTAWRPATAPGGGYGVYEGGQEGVGGQGGGRRGLRVVVRL